MVSIFRFLESDKKTLILLLSDIEKKTFVHLLQEILEIQKFAQKGRKTRGRLIYQKRKINAYTSILERFLISNVFSNIANILSNIY